MDLIEKVARFLSPEAFVFGMDAIVLRPKAMERAQMVIEIVREWDKPLPPIPDDNSSRHGG
jgi:hypothetical protein